MTQMQCSRRNCVQTLIRASVIERKAPGSACPLPELLSANEVMAISALLNTPTSRLPLLSAALRKRKTTKALFLFTLRLTIASLLTIVSKHWLSMNE